MKPTSRLLVLLVLATSVSVGQTSYPSYYRQNDFLLASPGAFKFGLYGYDNPALTSLLREPDVSFLWSDQNGKWDLFNRWGVFAAAPGVGFGLIHEKSGTEYVTDYKVSLSTGDRTLSSGIAYGWSSGYARSFNRSSLVTVGSLFRPNPFLSVGFIGTLALQSRGANEAALDVAVRPLGSERVTIFGDYGIQDKDSPQKGHWSAGGALEILHGICFTGRYLDTKAFTIGVQLSLGRGGVTTQAHYDANQKHAYNTYGLRIGAFDRTTFTSRGSSYLNLDLIGPIKYQRFRFLDNAHTLSDLLDAIDAAKEDPAVAGIAVNTSGMVADKELLWEVREQLKEFRTTGKRVVMFVDQADMTKYHFASVADKIVMDPQGLLQLNGFAMGRTFLKGTLEKVGIGFDEWRFFKYKSANENLSRANMSDADREQRQKLVDDSYRLAKTDICASRGFSPERFDAMINNEVAYMASDAVKKGLVDTLGRWETVEEVIKNLEGTSKRYVAAGSLDRSVRPTDARWSEPPTIAVIYALGACAMDEGITARRLVNDVEAAVKNSKVKAIVLRVDSPGGDPVASDYIAEALRKAKGKKPIIVSQGAVAASGGYWLSMYADTIVAAPTTITGSIGVIGGWLYNKGIKETMGISTDLVKAGDHADLGFGLVLPFIGLGLPDRNLTEAERSRMEYTIRSMYKEFVQRVATGRKKTEEYIGSIAQGRVWSGYDGLSNGLVDVLGGLETAINIAKERAGIPKGDEIDILALPKPGFINFSQFIPKIIGVESGKKDPLLEHLKFRLQHNGQPMPVLPVEDIDFLRQY
jgi:protease-4